MTLRNSKWSSAMSRCRSVTVRSESVMLPPASWILHCSDGLRRVPWMAYERPCAPRSMPVRSRFASVQADGWKSGLTRGISRYVGGLAPEPEELAVGDGDVLAESGEV